MTQYLRDEIRNALETEFSDEINETVFSILEAENLQKARMLRDEQIESVYRQINPGGARIILSFWSPSS